MKNYSINDFVKKYKCQVYEKLSIEEQNYKIGPFDFNVIFTPGHSEDSVTYYFFREHTMFVGDFIFEGNIGRCDLEGGSVSEMEDSLHKIKGYPDDVIIYPGHGNSSILGVEKKFNIYLRG